MSVQEIECVILDSQGDPDSLGETIHPNYRDSLPHVEFHGVTPQRYRGELVHGHGSWCGWHIFSQIPTHIKVVCYFMRMFGGTGSSDLSESDLRELMNELPARRPGVPRIWNNSWGGGSWSRSMIDYMLALWGDDAVCAAAGNSGKLVQSDPWRRILHVKSLIVVAAVGRDYARLPFSETGMPDGPSYPKTAALGRGLALDGPSGNIISWQGTSEASPNGLGAIATHVIIPGGTGLDVMPWIVEYSLGDTDGDGYPNGINRDWVDRIRNGELHHEVGAGVIEGARQENMAATGNDLATTDGLRLLEQYPMYHDFNRIW